MSQQETERTFTPEQFKMMKSFIALCAGAGITDDTTLAIINHRARTILQHIENGTIDTQALTEATRDPVAAPAGEPAQGRKLQNRNTEEFEHIEDYHNGDFYAAPVTYHNREIMCWHVFDKTLDKNGYCAARNIRTRFEACNLVDEFSTLRKKAEAAALNAGAPGDAETQGTGGA